MCYVFEVDSLPSDPSIQEAINRYVRMHAYMYVCHDNIEICGFFMTIRRLVTQFDLCLSTKPYFLNINECL